MTSVPMFLGGDDVPNGSSPGAQRSAYPTAAIKTGATIAHVAPTSPAPLFGSCVTAPAGKRNVYIMGVALGAEPTDAQVEANAYGDAATAASTTAPIAYVSSGYVVANVESGVTKGDELVPSWKTAGKLRTRPANINAVVAGANADHDITVTGIRKEHAHDISVHLVTDPNPEDVTDVTGTVTITADDTIQLSGSSANKKLVITARAASGIAIALEDARASAGSSTALVAAVELLGGRDR